MILRNRNILLISPEPWDHIFVSKHHYAVCLGRRGNKVFFLNPPGKSQSATETEHQNVHSVRSTGFPKGLRFYPRFLQKYFIRQKFYELERLCNVQFDAVWSFDNSVFFDFSALPRHIITISHIVDLSQDFEFAAATRTATICFGVSRSIVQKQRAYNPRSYFINHGYPVPSSDRYFPLPENHFAFRVGYAGNLNLKYIDWQAFRHVILAHPESGFFFAGPYAADESNIKWLKKQANVFLLGRFPSEMLPSFYSRLDLLVICYRSDEHIKQLENTHKMMEYLGSGKAIISTFIAEYAEFDNSLLIMTRRNEQFPAMFDRMLAELKFWSDPKKLESRKRVALDNTYDKQLDRIEAFISENLPI